MSSPVKGTTPRAHVRGKKRIGNGAWRESQETVCDPHYVEQRVLAVRGVLCRLAKNTMYMRFVFVASIRLGWRGAAAAQRRQAASGSGAARRGAGTR